MADIVIRFRIDEETKEKFREKIEGFGLTMTDYLLWSIWQFNEFSKPEEVVESVKDWKNNR